MGVRVLITREQPDPLSRLLQERGLDWVHVPLVRLHPTGFDRPPGRPAAALVTSAAVVRFVPRLCEYLHGARVVAVGQKTAMALTNADVVVDAVGTSGGLQALELLATRADEEAWYIGAEEPSSALDAGLKHAQLERWAVYRNQTPHDSADQLKSSDFDCVTFASGSAVRAFVGALGVPTVPVVVLGRSTRVVAENLGVSVASMASKPTMTALANAISEVG